MNSKFLKSSSIVLYLISFVLPVFSGSNEAGVSAFIFGIFIAPVAWLSNILYLANFIFKKKLFKIVCLCLAIVFALTTYSIKEINTEIEFNTHTKVSPGIGVYVWISSFIVAAVSIYLPNKKSQDAS